MVGWTDDESERDAHSIAWEAVSGSIGGTSREYLDERAAYSRARLEEVKNAVERDADITDRSELCIYAAGSFGRLEAWKTSDLDLFCVATGAAETNPGITTFQKRRVDERLIEIADLLEFPQFSDDGKYLDTHFIDDILEALGSQIDDYKNHFTARLLLLLESRLIYNEPVYDKARLAIVDSYFRDFSDHPKDFRPVFFVNDVIRYWKTVCLNYEQSRNRGVSAEKVGKHRIRNLKLKFSRMLTCFSAIIAVAHERGLQQDGVRRILSVPPLERLHAVCTTDERRIALYSRIIDLYAWFLDLTAKTRPELIEWLDDPKHRTESLQKAGEFGTAMYSLLCASTDDETLRYIVI